jgi:hypothetical protein
MSFIQKIFSKPRSELSLNDLINYFLSPQEESSVVEFKSGGVEINDIFKEITAFLNTEGGLLIIGSPKERTLTKGKNKIKICEGELSYSSFRNKDWLYQKIASNIVPAPTDLKIEEFITEQGNVFVIDIPQSFNPPHQSTADGRYYLRLEREAKPAPHGIVQALFTKRKVPKLTAEVVFNNVDESTDEVVVAIKNISNIPAEKVSYIIDVYNVNEVNSSQNFIFIKDSLGDKFSLSRNSDQILVRVISFIEDFKIKHFDKEYVVFVGFWCKELDFEYNYYTYSPKQNRVTSKGTQYSGPLLEDELERIQNK